MLSPEAQKIITNYLRLPFAYQDIFCPYFINKKNKIRGALRALIGKGTPDEIVEEATICALKEKINLATLDTSSLRKFLVDHHIGVDCSGFVYHVLDTELKTNKKPSLGKSLHFPTTSNFFKKIIAKIRPAENANVQTFAHNANSKQIDLKNIQPGDVIVITDAGKDHGYQHIILVHDVIYETTNPTNIHYTHSIELPQETWQEHGVRQGTITITNPEKSLLEQVWFERGQAGENNKFYVYAKTARSIKAHRLHCLT